MKKIILLVLAALVLVALVACGGETTTASTTTEAPGTTTEAPGTTEDPGNTGEPGNPGETGDALYSEGIDILCGEPDDRVIAAFPGGLYGEAPFLIEDHHADLKEAGNKWALVFKIQESGNVLYDVLFPPMEDEEGNITRQPNPLHQWIIVINGKPIYVKDWANGYGETGCDFTRAGLGDWEPQYGEQAYEISIKIIDAESDEEVILYWANFADELLGGAYIWARPEKLGMVGATIPEGYEKLLGEDVNYLEGITGPKTNPAESYTNLFDADVNTKLCTGDQETAIYFQISEKVTAFDIKGMSIVGANDDQDYGSRCPKKFTLYGTNDSAVDTTEEWTPLLTVEEETINNTNYAERYYDLESEGEVKFRYYKLVVEQGDMYQFSELLFYVVENEWAATE